MTDPHDGASVGRLLFGVYAGVVADNRDPEHLGRVKVKLPWQPNSYVTDWTRVATAMAGPGYGAYALPEVGDDVLLAFEHGDPSRPIVIASLWSPDRPPPEANADGRNDRRKIRSRSGHEVLLDDGDAGTIELRQRDGRTSLTLGPNYVTLIIGSAHIHIRGDGSGISVSTGAELDLKLQDVRLEARNLEFVARLISLLAGTRVELKGIGGVGLNGDSLEVL